MSDLVKFQSGGALMASPEDLVKGLQSVGATMQGSSGGLAYLRLLKSGVYAYGPENIEPEEGSEWAVNPYSLHHGFACWGDGELLDERMVPFNQPPPAQNELPDYGQPWMPQYAVQMRCMNGEDEGITVLYKGTSTGLRNAMKKMIAEIVAQAQHDPKHVVPVIDLDIGSYQHKKYGEIFFPVMEISRWLNIDNADDDEQPEAEPETKAEAAPPEPEAQPKPRRRRKAAEKPEAAQTGTNKKRRRRAKAS